MQSGELWLVLFGAAALTARLGLCLYLTGASRSKNAAAAVIRTVADFCIAIVAFWFIGNAVLRGDVKAVLGLHDSFGAAAFFNSTMILIATGAAIGGTLERTRFVAPLLGSFLLAAIVAPLVGHWVWSGWLHRMGFIDVGGAAALHLCGGVVAAAGAMRVGPRAGKYNRDGSANLIPGHSAPLAAAGVMALAVGILAQITGCAMLRNSPAGAAAANGLLACAAGGLAGLILGRARYGWIDLHFMIAGMLSGLVASSAGAGLLAAPEAFIIGAGAGLMAPLIAVRVDLRLKIDDPAWAIAIHGAGGAWGLLAAAIALPVGNGFIKQVGIQVLGIVVVGCFAFAASGVLFLILKSAFGPRHSDADELDGSDLVEHDLNAYPDFQQTMIKSYHLRET